MDASVEVRRWSSEINRLIKKSLAPELNARAIDRLKRRIHPEYHKKLVASASSITDFHDATCTPTPDNSGVEVHFEDSKIVIELGENAFLFDFEDFYANIPISLRRGVKQIVRLYNRNYISNVALQVETSAILTITFQRVDAPPVAHVVKSLDIQ